MEEQLTLELAALRLQLNSSYSTYGHIEPSLEQQNVIHNRICAIESELRNMKSQNNIVKCEISRYDETITEPPYLTIQVDSVDVNEPIEDNLGEQFASNLKSACSALGYRFKFYTMSSKNEYDYEIVVY